MQLLRSLLHHIHVVIVRCVVTRLIRVEIIVIALVPVFRHHLGFLLVQRLDVGVVFVSLNLCELRIDVFDALIQIKVFVELSVVLDHFAAIVIDLVHIHPV